MILTKKQREVFSYIESFIQRNGYSPSLEEIAQGLGLRSLATVHKHVANLQEKGMLVRGWNRGRTIEVLPDRSDSVVSERPMKIGAVEIALLGRVAAGLPIEAVETPETLTVPEEMLGQGETFALQVRGSSMIDEQIRDGDYVIVERREVARNGETVVALVRGHETTLKKFYREGRQVRLQPANAELAPIRVKAEDVAIQGVVIGLIRHFG